nr:Chromosome segregation ATPases (Smc) [uncultured Mediterranean phage uvMED]
MAKEVIVDVKVKVANAKGQLDELNKSLSASEDLVSDLEQELEKLNNELENSNGVTNEQINAQVKLYKEIENTKSRIDREKKSIVDINKKRKEQNKTIKDSTKSTADYSGVIGIVDRQTGGLISGVTGLTGSIGKATGGFKLLRTAIIATGLGALVVAITSVASAFSSSEEGQNKFRKFFTQISVIVGNVTDILSDFGNVIISVFTGNFKEAGKALSEVTDGIKNFGEETRKEIAIAGELADRRAKADLLERKLLVDRAEATRKFNELREKAADKENVSIEDRIAALKEAGRIEEEITLKEIEAARIRFETKKQQNELSNSTKQDLDEQAQLEARLIELEASRLKKQKTLTAEITTNLREAESERKRIQAEADAEQKRIDDEKAAKDKEATDAKLAAEKQLAELKKQIRDAEAVSEDEKRALEIEKVTAHYDNLIALAEKNGLDITDLEAAKNKRLAEFKDTEIVLEEMTSDMKLQIAKDTLKLIAMVAGEGSRVGKAAAIAQATISAVEGTINAFKSAQDSPITTFFPAYPFLQAGIATAAGAAQIAKIKAVKVGGVSSGNISGGSISGGISTPTTQAPSFNIVGSDPQTQLAQAIGQQTQKPVKAFVVAGDVSTAQSLDRNIIQESSLG